MTADRRYTRVTWKIMEQLLEVDSIGDALSGSLEIIYNTLNSEAGAIWLLDKATGTPVSYWPCGYLRRHCGKRAGHRRNGHQNGQIHHGHGCPERPTIRRYSI